MKKIIGYCLGIVGIAGLSIASIPGVFETIPLPEQITPQILLIASITLAVIGVFLVIKSGPKKNKIFEVPIFEGENVIGYRRQGKK